MQINNIPSIEQPKGKTRISKLNPAKFDLMLCEICGKLYSKTDGKQYNHLPKNGMRTSGICGRCK